jgi:hypothetical protein
MNNKVSVPTNGVGGILMTLASSGDNWVKLLIVAGLLINTLSTNKNSGRIEHNTKELDGLRNQVAGQVKVLYDNQHVFADYMDESRAALDRLQTKQGIAHPLITPYPRVEMHDR